MKKILKFKNKLVIIFKFRPSKGSVVLPSYEYDFIPRQYDQFENSTAAYLCLRSLNRPSNICSIEDQNFSALGEILTLIKLKFICLWLYNFMDKFK